MPPGELEWRPEFDERFELLFEHFSISKDDPECWQKLALALSKNHVPGFQDKQRETRGRPSEWQITDEFALWYEFDILVKNRKSERQAAKIILERHPDIKASPSALLIRLKRFDKRLKAETECWWKQKHR